MFAAGGDARGVTVEPGTLIVTEGGSASYTVALSAQPSGVVTVAVTGAAAKLTIRPRELTFSTVDWESPKTVTVSAHEDGDAVADAPVQLSHTVAGGGYDGIAAPPAKVIVVENDASTLAMAQAHALERSGGMAFEVTVSLAVDRPVTVDYATAATEGSATEGGL